MFDTLTTCIYSLIAWLQGIILQVASPVGTLLLLALLWIVITLRQSFRS